jgi:hypothetical protein
MRVNERLDEAAALARKLLVLIESARARESSDRILAVTPAEPSPLQGTPEVVPQVMQALAAYIEQRLPLEAADAAVLEDALGRLMRAAAGENRT